ncbi:anoctamin-3-like [Tribolium madens]|uniref:anoctamin-3-like n=1 Tax=Tribolium madens TaxID=41895 RepID=UPI001CF72775|nr:anoctamin-3-like [Tribolium madens]
MDEKRIDYVIVFESKIKDSENYTTVEKFMKFLEEQGLELQLHSDEAEKFIFLTLHIPGQLLHEFAHIYNVKLTDSGHGPAFGTISSIDFADFNFFNAPINDKNFIRERGPTTTERILIAYEILSEAKFGDDENDYGIEKLIRLGIVKTAYPLHDGDFEWDDKEGGYLIPENDRQLLLKYWANFSLWYKEQPLNLIEKYFGTEVGFYFAWLGFYNRMLIPAAVVGLVCSIISFVQLFFMQKQRTNEICSSDLPICPICRTGDGCVRLPLNSFCTYAKISTTFDNKETVFFAVFMSFWATLFTKLWQRVESTLKIQWNVEFEKIDTKLRLEYKEKSTHKTWSYVYERPRPYTPTLTKAFYLTLSYGTCFLMIMIVILFVYGLAMFRVTITDRMQRKWTPSQQAHVVFVLILTSACIQVIFVKLFAKFYRPVSSWLTNLENPRTQSDFDSSIISKRYILAFANNYAPLLYIAFLMDRFYAPDDPPDSFQADRCGPTGCLMPLCVQLCFLMLLKSFFGNLLTLIAPKLTTRFQKKRTNHTDRPQWEREFDLNPSRQYLLTTEFMEMIIQYGFVTFFVAAFPLAPLCALINNCLELRLDAYKLVTRHRRPIPKQESGISTWNNILHFITHLSVATNAFVLAFTSDFVARIVYKATHNKSLDGYIEWTMSLYNLDDYDKPIKSKALRASNNSSRLCYYKALRYPPDHPKEYQQTDYFFYETGMRLLCVIIFEHIIMITNGVLAYFIPSVPENVKEMLHHEKTQEFELQMKMKNTVRRRKWRKTPK